jgi:hypothetical protein
LGWVKNGESDPLGRQSIHDRRPENPTLTIVTLAIRQADYIADQTKSNTI